VINLIRMLDPLEKMGDARLLEALEPGLVLE
jgi:hypothetical protein